MGREKVLVNHMWSNWMKGRSRAVSSYISGVRTSTVCAIQYNTIQYNTIHYNTIQYNTNNTIQYNTIQYNTIQYNTIQYNTIKLYFNTVKSSVH